MGVCCCGPSRIKIEIVCRGNILRYSKVVMKKLKNLSVKMTASEQREVCLREHIKIKPHKFKKEVVLKDKQKKEIEIEILEVSREKDLLKVIVKVWRDEKEIFVDNPLYYVNPPICVFDGTFEKKIEIETGREKQIANCVENPEEALRQIIVETIRVTSLKEE